MTLGASIRKKSHRTGRPGCSQRAIVCVVLAMLLATAAAAAPPDSPRKAGEPIRLMWIEGDVAGLTSIYSPDGLSVIGFVRYRQHRRGDIIQISRLARFNDGSSDEDRVKARVGRELQTIGGRTIIRNNQGVPTVDLKIDIASGRITG